MQLSEQQLSKLTATDADRTLTDSPGVRGRVRAGVDGKISVSFLFRYRFDGKHRDAPLGTWPHKSLHDIRRAVLDAKTQLEAGIDLVGQKQEARKSLQLVSAARDKLLATQRQDIALAECSFKALFEAWLEDGTIAKNKDAMKSSVTRHLCMFLDRPAGTIFGDEFVPVLRAIASKTKSVAIALFRIIRRMYGWALTHSKWTTVIRFSPLAATKQHIITGQYLRKFNKRALRPHEIPLLDRRIQETHIPEDRAVWGKARMTPLPADSEHGIWILLGTMMRVGELCNSLRSYVNFERREWRLPPDIVKTENQHVIHLSDFVIGHLEKLFALSDSPWVMPHPDDPMQPMPPQLFSKRIGDRQKPRRARKTKTRQSPTWTGLDLPGGRWMLHDLRRTGASLMQEQMILPVVIERCLNHFQESDIRRTYQVYAYEPQMKEAWLVLGQYLDQLLNPTEPGIERRPVAPPPVPAEEDWEVLPAARHWRRSPSAVVIGKLPA
ncbi:tyrosine-type recombinase/integrase [Caballeronia grimmiae]|uniref:Integrase n=1 Tax=Caballeronia grimmiae TaxID=1071679 RepID=A0A069PA44_9BURK|nr:integrase family protein [Caballeronia grimmiae]KDR36699.1 integrase [Caballeronia grimmiae]GGD78410.1 integrase [Caballeronia grimmiae]